ncbi:hypothetical protein [Olsenella profusa]|uniref:DUF697 domain-containing protein n=1 Tax=Olsenella profusa TaxID=138595 RepID=A0ABS2EZF4_9ACTN|nr:hypothetical protein [Olsenella profusa]MBM6774091.1 hypothetical protein [Olsenella profusa]
MAKGGWTAARVAEVLSSGRAAIKGRDARVALHVRVDPTCPHSLACAVRDALVPERPGGVVEVCSLASEPGSGAEPVDAALVLVGVDAAAAVGVAASYARSGVNVAFVVEGALDAPEVELPEQAAALVGVVAASSAEALPDRLAAWLARVCAHPLALAANFPACRRAVVDALVARCAVENAAVGAISLIPGSDLPIMCANQAKLALDVAAAYGRGVDASRAAELAGVLAGGLTWRALARALVGALPGVGGLVKAGVGFGGTMAVGQALRLRFEAEDALAGRDAHEGATGEAAPVLLATAEDADDGYVTIEGGAA